MAGYTRRRRDDVNYQIRQAHSTAVFTRIEKLKPVDSYLIGSKNKAPSGQVPASEGLAAWASVLQAQGFGRPVQE